MQPGPDQLNRPNPHAPLVELRGAGYRAGGRRILSRIDWRLSPGQHWGITGPNGSGKSTFMRLVRGEIWPGQGLGERLYRIGGSLHTSPLGFRERTGMVSPELMDRYQRSKWRLSALEMVITGHFDTPLLYQDPSPKQLARAEEALDRVGLAHLAARPIRTLSRGQAKRVLIARALVANPMALFLDECCEGLDPAARERLLALIQRLAEAGIIILQATHRPEELIPAISHTLTLQQGRIVSQGPREAPASGIGLMHSQCEDTAQTQPGPAPRESAPLVLLKDVDVYRDRELVLKGLNWRIMPGEHWGVLGPNGAGKTTLLKLISGDLLPALGGEIAWFGIHGRPTLWDLRGVIGLVSAELQTRHRYTQTGLETVISGEQGSIGLSARPTPEQVRAAERWLEFFEIAGLAQREVHTLSYGQMRKLLLARAMVHDPKLLLMDEPVAGLDPPAREEVLKLIQKLAGQGVGLIMVTHHPQDLIPAIGHIAELGGGGFTYLGLRKDWPGPAVPGPKSG